MQRRAITRLTLARNRGQLRISRDLAAFSRDRRDCSVCLQLTVAIEKNVALTDLKIDAPQIRFDLPR